MYLETAQYQKAAEKYADYLCKYEVLPEDCSSYRRRGEDNIKPDDYSEVFNQMNDNYCRRASI